MFSAKIFKGGGLGSCGLGGDAFQVPFWAFRCLIGMRVSFEMSVSFEMWVSNVQYMCMVFATSGHDAISDCPAIPTTEYDAFLLHKWRIRLVESGESDLWRVGGV